MTWLDPATTSLVTALVVTVCCIVYLTDTLSYVNSTPARLWAVSFATGVLTASAYMIWAFLPTAWMAVAAGNASFVASIGFLWLGCRRFNRPALGWATWLLTAAVVAAFAAAALVGPDGGDWAGAGVMIAAIAVLAGLGCVETRRGRLARIPTSGAMTIVLGVVCVYYAARTVAFVLAGPSSPLFLQWFGTPSTSLVTIVMTIVAVTTMVVLRIHDQTASQSDGAGRLALRTEGLVDRPTFLRVLAATLVRAGRSGAPTTVVALHVPDLQQVAAAFGPREANRVGTRLRESVAALAPPAATVGTDGDDRLLLCLVDTTEAEGRAAATALSHAVLDRLHTLETPVVPVLGVGTATATPGDRDPGPEQLVAAARRAAAASAEAADGVVVVAPSAGGKPVPDAADGLDPAG